MSARFLGSGIWGPSLLAALAMLTAAAARAEGPSVIASVPPVHSLVAGVMEGVGRPHLLLGKGASPHGYALKPSDAKVLGRARLVVWVGPALERFLARPLATLARGAETLALIEAPGLRRLPVRRGGVWESHDHGHAHGRSEAHHEGEERHEGDAHHEQEEHHEEGEGGPASRGAVDPHIWLDPRNAAAMVDAIAQALARADRAHAPRYRANAGRMKRELAALDEALAARLAPVRRKPHVVFHDAYQYFERRYGLNAVGAVTLDPQRPPGAKRLIALKARIRASGAACVFAEPQFEPRLLATVIEGTGARAGTLDPVGAALEPGPGLYAALMENLAGALVDCLGAR